MKVLHVIAEFSAHEAMGRTVLETVRRLPGEHLLLTVAAHDTQDAFVEVVETGGSVGTFPLGRTAALVATVLRLRPDVVHLHAGALGPAQTSVMRRQLRRAVRAQGLPAATAEVPLVLTAYAWPALPTPRAMRRVRPAQLWRSNVVRPRVVLTTLLPASAARRALHLAGVHEVLSPDPRVLARLDGRLGPRAHALPSGAPRETIRAQRREPGQGPVVLFAGRAESVRGLDVLLRAFPAVLAAVPDARLRLLLIPRPELDEIRARARALGPAVEVVTEPVADLAAELAAAQVGTWPFLFDYTTSPPAMALAEAMAVGLPVVATDVACVRAVARDERDAVIVPPGAPDALAAGIVTLLRDATHWQRLALAGPRSTGSRLGWDRTSATTADAYARARARTPGAVRTP